MIEVIQTEDEHPFRHRSSTGSCCAPARPQDVEKTPAPGFRRVDGGNTRGMRLLPGGEFIMGTDGGYGYAEDGEGPAHSVRLAPFWIDPACVTNEQFNEFVNANGYRTEAERFGWSFVLFGHLPHAP